jgi:hypothetical protein
MQTKNWIEKYSLFWAFLFLSVLMGGAYFLLSPVWGSSIEQQLHWRLGSEGVVNKGLHPLLFNTLQLLYAQNDQLSWLAILLYTAQGISLWAVTTLFLHHSGSRWRIGIFAVSISALLWPLWQNLSIEATAILLSATTMVLLWQCFQLQKHWKSWLLWLLPAIFMSLAVALDFKASVLGLCLLPLLLHSWMLSPKKSLRHLLQLALLALLGLSLVWTKLQAQSEKPQAPASSQEVLAALQKYDWEGYRWNQERGLFYSQQLGWRAADYRLIQSGYAADADFLAPEVLKLLKEEFGHQTQYSREGLRRKLNRFALYELRYAGGWLALLLLLLLFGFLNFKALKGLAWAVLASTFAWMGFLLYSILVWQASTALFWAGLAMIGLSALLVVGFRGHLSKANKWTLLFFLLISFGGSIYWNWEKIEQTQNLPLDAELMADKIEQEAHILIFDSKDFLLGQSVWTMPQQQLQLHYLKEWNSLPAEQLIQNLDQAPHYLFMEKEAEWSEDYQVHLLEHYRFPIKLDSLEVDEGTEIYLYGLERDSL